MRDVTNASRFKVEDGRRETLENKRRRNLTVFIKIKNVVYVVRANTDLEINRDLQSNLTKCYSLRMMFEYRNNVNPSLTQFCSWKVEIVGTFGGKLRTPFQFNLCIVTTHDVYVYSIQSACHKVGFATIHARVTSKETLNYVKKSRINKVWQNNHSGIRNRCRRIVPNDSLEKNSRKEIDVSI